MKERASRLQSAYGELLKRKLASTKKDIAEKMRASAPNVSSAFNGDPRVLTDRFLSRFNAAYDNIFNLEWLLTGEGNMLKEDEALISYEEGVPYYDEDFVLGFTELGVPFSENPQFLVKLPKYQNATLWCNATGDSMVPEINSGDVIALQLIDDPSFLVYGDVYAIVTTNGLRTIKRLGRSEDKNCYRLIPTNREYDDQDIPKNKILRVFRVLGNLHTF